MHTFSVYSVIADVLMHVVRRLQIYVGTPYFEYSLYCNKN